MDRNTHTIKTKLVTKGYTQTQEIDYEETLSPIVMIILIRIQLATTTFHDYEMWQMDVQRCFEQSKCLK